MCDGQYDGVTVEKPRQIAVRILRRHADQKDYLEDLLDEELARAALAPADRGLVRELCCGVVRWQATLDWLITRKTQGRVQKVPLQILLRLGLYQTFWLDRIPDHAIVHESVEIAKELGFGPQSGFINALLRGCLREREAIAATLIELKASQPALGYSHPQWLCDRWQEHFGAEQLRPLLEWNNTPPVTYARVNTLKTTPEQLAAQFEQEGVRFRPHSFDWAKDDLVFELKSHPSLATLPSFQQGRFYVQDPSTLLAVRALDPQPGDTVLDYCAAPGGKTTFIAQLMQNKGLIRAQDVELHRRELIRQNCERLGVTCVQIVRAAGTVVFAELSAPFDRVLVDAPCLNTGVLRRRVDLRWRLRPAEITRLTANQLGLLLGAATQLKAGGTLVYSTCSLEPEENGGVVQQFLAAQKDFRLAHERQLLSCRDPVDGAYVAALIKGG